MNASLNKYLNNQITTASPEKLLLMLYDGAIRFTRMARQALADNDQAGRRHFIGKTLAIITEFSNTLDHQIGGEIATNLDSLYHYMMRELTAANLKADDQPLGVVEKLLTDLRATWAEAIALNNAERQKAADTRKKSTAPQAAAYTAL
jgi:flagellar protein FliS